MDAGLPAEADAIDGSQVGVSLDSLRALHARLRAQYEQGVRLVSDQQRALIVTEGRLIALGELIDQVESAARAEAAPDAEEHLDAA